MALEHSQAAKSLWTVLLVAGLVAAVVLASVGCTQSETSQENGEASGDMHTQTQTVTIPVEGMSCGACAARVKGALKDIDGVADVEVNLAERNVRVSYIDGRVAPEDLVVAINGLAYKASLPTAVEKEADDSAGRNPPQSADSQARVTSVTISVEGMACESCAETLKRRLTGIDGVKDVRVSLKEKEARIQYDEGNVTPESMAEAIEAQGFTARNPIAKEEK